MAGIKDSGERREFTTGSVRDVSRNKGDFSLLVQGWPFVMRSLARHLQEGAKKYGKSNWLRGQFLSSYLDSATRHLFAFGAGKTDEPHIIAAIWNLLCLVETWFRIRIGILPKELNDLNVPVVVWDEELTDDVTYRWSQEGEELRDTKQQSTDARRATVGDI
jgi:hypothetical protein